MGLDRIGPVVVDHRNPTLTWTSGASISGARSCRIAGQSSLASVQQLSEMVTDPDQRITIGEHAGVLKYVVMTGDVVGAFRGWYLLDSFDDVAERPWSVTPFAPFSLSAAYLGEREPIILRSSRPRLNDFAISAVAAVADPFWTEAGTDQSMGFSLLSSLTREYDPRPHAPDLPALSPSGRKLVYVTTVTADESLVIVPEPRRNDADVPTWASLHGGDVRAFDRSEDREVFGPSHPFERTSDLLVTNGMVRFWIGNRGLIPWLNVAAFRSGEWREMGVVSLAPTAGALAGARLIRCTPDEATVALSVRTTGAVHVTLRRGERMIRLGIGPERSPSTSYARTLAWDAMPPTLARSSVSSAAGRFGSGASVAAGGALTFAWPGDASSDAWSVSGRWTPDAASTAKGDTTIGSVNAVDGTPLAVVAWRASDDKVTLTMDGVTIAGPVLTFSSGQAVGFCARFDTVSGLALSVNVADGVVSHSSDPAQTDPATASAALGSLTVLVPVPGGGGGGAVPYDSPAHTYDDATVLYDGV